MALQLPVEVTNIPTQPVFPSRVIAQVNGITNWWTTHEQDVRVGLDGKQAIRPVVGDAPLPIGDVPFTFEPLTQNGKTRRPAVCDGNDRKFWTVPVAVDPAWTTYAMCIRIKADINGRESTFIKFATSGLMISPRRTNSATVGGSVTLQTGPNLGTGERIIEFTANAVPTGTWLMMLLAHNATTGLVKIQVNDSEVFQSAAGAAVVSGEATATVDFGRWKKNHPFEGHLGNLGRITGDVLSDPASLSHIRTYRQALYGV